MGTPMGMHAAVPIEICSCFVAWTDVQSIG